MARAMPKCGQVLTSTPPRGRETLPGSAARPGAAGAFLTAIPGGRMTPGNDMFIVSVWNRLRHHVPDVAPPPCKCSGAAAKVDYAMICKQVPKMTQMRNDNLENASRLVASRCGCKVAAEPRYLALVSQKGIVECQRRVTSWRCCHGSSLRQWLPWLRMRLRSRTLLGLPTRLGGLRRGLNTPSGHGLGSLRRIMLLSSLCRLRLRRAGPGYMGKEEVKFVNHLGDIAAESRRVPKGLFFLRWVVQLLLVMVKRGNAQPEWVYHVA